MAPLAMTTTLGDQVRDTVTGLEGIVVSRTEFLHGCIRVGVQPRAIKDGTPAAVAMFDEPQLAILKVGAVRGFGDRLRDAAGALVRRGGARDDVPARPAVRR